MEAITQDSQNSGADEIYTILFDSGVTKNLPYKDLDNIVNTTLEHNTAVAVTSPLNKPKFIGNVSEFMMDHNGGCHKGFIIQKGNGTYLL